MQTLWTPEEYKRAYLFAARAQRGQSWPGDKDLPYIAHFSLVSIEIITALNLEKHEGLDGDLAIKCALLHDVVEDAVKGLEETITVEEQIRAEFGKKVADGVLALTKNKNLPKNQRLDDCLVRIKLQPSEIWMVKMADRIVNLEPPPDFWTTEKKKQYHKDAIKIYNSLKDANEYLAKRLGDKIGTYKQFST